MRKTKVKMNKPVYLGFPVLKLSEVQIMSFGMIILKKNIIKKLNYVIFIQIVL